MNGTVAIIQLDREIDGVKTSVLMIEVAMGEASLTITDQDGQPISDEVRKQAERLMETILKENKS